MTVATSDTALVRPTGRGLTSAEAARRRQDGLGNDYRPPTSRPVSVILRTNVFTRFNALLGSLLVVILVVGPVQDALFGLALLANTVAGIVQELRAKRALDRLAVVTAPRATVVRDGASISLPAQDVVVDDLLQQHRREHAVAADAGDHAVARREVHRGQLGRLDDPEDALHEEVSSGAGPWGVFASVPCQPRLCHFDQAP